MSDDKHDEHTCLHCRINATITAHFDELGYHHPAGVVINSAEVLGVVALVLGEQLAMIDNYAVAGKRLVEVARIALKHAIDIREHGLQGETIQVN